MKILIIDDHTLFREGLTTLLVNDGLEVIGACANTSSALPKAKTMQPQIILLDLRMPEQDGLSALPQLREAAPDASIVMLTTSTDPRDLHEALALGAKGYLLKDSEPAELVAHLQAILQGEMVVAPRMAVYLAENDPQTSEAPPGNFDRLTPRECEILECLALGQSNKVIARKLGIAEGTVKLHVKSILKKLDVHSRVEAAIMMVERQRRSG